MLYHRHFSVQRRDEKLSLQKKIKELREELGKVLSESLGSSRKVRHIADWDPVDPQTVAGFFDPFWMFGRSLGEGFDIVIGNPPYVSYGLRGVGTLTKEERDEVVTQFPNSAEYKISVYALFMERCISLQEGSTIHTDRSRQLPAWEVFLEDPKLHSSSVHDTSSCAHQRAGI